MQPSHLGRTRRGFTTLEAVLAAFVLMLAVGSSLGVIRRAFASLDTARNLMTAGQIMQTEIEKFRGQPWATVSTLPTSTVKVPLDAAYSALPNVAQFALTRTISSVEAGMLRIDFTISWANHDGHALSRTYTTYYAQYGLYDWFVLV